MDFIIIIIISESSKTYCNIEMIEDVYSSRRGFRWCFLAGLFNSGDFFVFLDIISTYSDKKSYCIFDSYQSNDDQNRECISLCTKQYLSALH